MEKNNQKYIEGLEELHDIYDGVYSNLDASQKFYSGITYGILLGLVGNLLITNVYDLWLKDILPEFKIASTIILIVGLAIILISADHEERKLSKLKKEFAHKASSARLLKLRARQGEDVSGELSKHF